MKKFIALLIFLIIIGTMVIAGSPYYTAYQLKTAYDTRDGEALVSHIDFAHLQTNIRSQLTHKFDDTLLQYPMVAQLGGAQLTQVADDFINRSVDTAVTPDNVKHLIASQGQANQATKELAAAWAIASNKVDLRSLIQDVIAKRGDLDAVVKNQINVMMTQQAKTLAAQAQTAEGSVEPKLAYCGFNCFTLYGSVKGYPVTVEMQRDGLTEWQVVNVVLP